MWLEIVVFQFLFNIISYLFWNKEKWHRMKKNIQLLHVQDLSHCSDVILIIISSKFFLVDLSDLMHTKNLHPRCVTKFLWYLSNGLEVITSYTLYPVILTDRILETSSWYIYTDVRQVHCYSCYRNHLNTVDGDIGHDWHWVNKKIKFRFIGIPTWKEKFCFPDILMLRW